ncbi:hypothetical protein CY35_08G139900 [Sphagnum magellanicum]|nr:hypothetical protein CY35_08G139900 [Sphagnum magellanicum]
MAESEWIRKIQSGLQAHSDQNARGDAPIKKLPACLRKPVERYTPEEWQFGLHNRDPQASSSESEVLKIRLAAACKLNPDEWGKFCADVVDNPADMMLKSYGLYSGVTELSPKDVQYLLTLDALTLVLVLSSLVRAPESESEPDQAQQLPNSFIRSLVAGGFNIEALVKSGVAYSTIWDDLFLCENQIPMALMKKAISKCYGLLPEERKSNDHDLRELEDPDSNVTKKLLDTILKIVAFVTCSRFFAEPCPDKKEFLLNLIDVNYEVGKLENCPHIFACIHKVMTSCLKSTTADKKSPATDTEVFAPDVNQQPETDVEALAAVGTPPIAVTTMFGRAKELFLCAVATSSKQPASVIATTFGISRETAAEEGSERESLQSATVLKKAGLKIQGIPGMVQQVAFKNGCLFLPIMSHSGSIESYICNMAAYEAWYTWPPYPFMDYLLLMSQLIRTPEDVSYLVDCDVIRPYLGTQQRIFQIWERLPVTYPPYSDEYKENIVKPINRHRACALKLMAIEFYSTYCSKPWLAISVISAFILLVATLIQTYVAVIGSDKMQPHYPRGG